MAGSSTEHAAHLLEAALFILRAGEVDAPEPEAAPTFKGLLKENNMTILEFSRLSGTPLSTAKTWSCGSSRTPGIAISWLRLFEIACSASSRAEVEAALLATSDSGVALDCASNEIHTQETQRGG